MATNESGGRAYQFGPLERRGLIAGFRAGQVAVAALGAMGVTLLALDGHPLAAVALIIGVGLVGFVPLGGRPVEAWAPIVAGWFLRRFTATTRWRSDACRLGHLDGEPAAPTLPEHLAGLRIVAAAGPDGQPMGVLRERGIGARRGWLYTAVLSVRPQAFALCDSEEQTRRLAGWGAILAGQAREGSPVRRVQWLERTAPAREEQRNEKQR